MRTCGTDGGYNTFTDPCEDRILTGTTNELLNIGTDGDPGNGDQLDTVGCHCCYFRSSDHLRIYGNLHGFKYITACKIDGRSLLECQIDIRLIG